VIWYDEVQLKVQIRTVLTLSNCKLFVTWSVIRLSHSLAVWHGFSVFQH